MSVHNPIEPIPSAHRFITRIRARFTPFGAFALLYAALVLIFLRVALLPPVGQAVGGLDVRALFHPWLLTARAAILSGRLPLWDDMQFGGYPFLSNPQVGLFYPPTWLAILLPVEAGIGWYLALHLWLAGLGMYLLIRELGGGDGGALLAGLAYGLSGFMAVRIFAGHIGLIATDTWLPWLLLSTAWAMRRASIPVALVAGVPLALAILAGHTTSLLYIGLAWAVFIIYLALTAPGAAGPRMALIIRQVALMSAIGLALSGVQLALLVEFSLVSTRASTPSLAFATDFSMPPAHLITLLIPEFFGEPTRSGYWSVPNFEELTYYAGALPVLALLFSLRRPKPVTWLALALTALGALLALGSYSFLYEWFYTLLPPFRLARAPGRAAFLIVLALCLALGTVADQASEDQPRSRFAPFTLIGYVMMVAAGLAATGAAFAAVHPSDTSGRLWTQIGGWSLALLFGGTGGWLLWRLLEAPAAKRVALIAGLALVLVADLWTFGWKLIRVDEVGPIPMWTEAKSILGNEVEGRVLPWGVLIFFQNDAGQVGLKSVFGYNALEIAANQAFAASVADPRSTAYDILGARYVVSGNVLEPALLEGERALRLIGETGSAHVYERGRVLPVARLVTRYEAITDDEAATARVHAPDFDPATTVILEREPGCTPSGTAGTARVIEERPGFWRIETESDGPALLILSETAYPGWQATLNGTKAEIMTAYTAIRAVCVPAGASEVVMRYDPASLKIGAGISLLALAGLSAAAFSLQRVGAASE
ncbi:MAG: hypothetical protein IT326_05325 [Anaerolineae bacterium]|nr:hypothetical protein [Anaerolineae bacterium]